jgi:uncharacterized protein (DUF305 family)
MKAKLTTFFLLLAVVIGFACNTQNSATNDNLHLGMNHNGMNMPTANQNTMNNQNMNHGEMNHSEMKSSPNAASAPYDLQFLDTMISHHQGAVEMAKSAETKAEHSELNTLAKNIITSQEKEITEMEAWREKWFAGKESAVNMEMAGMADSMKGMNIKNLYSLSGNAFDLEFIKQMITHHEGAVVMAKEALQKSQKEEIKGLANAIIKDQESEIKQMKDWQNNWSK